LGCAAFGPARGQPFEKVAKHIKLNNHRLKVGGFNSIFKFLGNLFKSKAEKYLHAGIHEVFRGSKFFSNTGVGKINKNLNIEYLKTYLPSFLKAGRRH
jgi:hypothetical protein